MRFANPQAFFLFILPLMAAAGLVTGYFLRLRVLGRFGDSERVSRLINGLSLERRVLKGFLLVLGLAAAVTALARPQYGGRTRMLRKLGMDIVVALDFSKSMLAGDVKPSRIDLAKRELSRLMMDLGGDRLGLVAFAGDAISFPLTTDYEAAAHFWKDLNPYDMPVGGTRIAGALSAAVRLLTGDAEDARRSKAIILLTDGEDHAGDVMEAARAASEHSIKIFAIGIGSDSPELIPRYLEDGTWTGYQKDDDGKYITTRLGPENEKTLREMASETGGAYYRAGAQLEGIGQVAQELKKMKKTELESRSVTAYEEVFTWFLWPALLLLLIERIISERASSRRRKAAAAGASSSAVLLLVLLFLPLSAHAFSLFESVDSDVKEAVMQMSENNYEEALKHFNKAAAEWPDDAGVRLNRGIALFHLGRHEEARQDFLAASGPDSPADQRAMAYYNMGNVHFELAEYEDAIEAYSHALRLNPGEPDAAHNLELARLRLEEKKKQEQKQKEEKEKEQQGDQEQQQDQDQQQEKEQDQKQDQKQERDKQQDQKQDQQQQQEQQQQEQQQQKQDKKEEKQQMPLESVLDSLKQNEKSFHTEQARKRAKMMQGGVRKDW